MVRSVGTYKIRPHLSVWLINIVRLVIKPRVYHDAGTLETKTQIIIVSRDLYSRTVILICVCRWVNKEVKSSKLAATTMAFSKRLPLSWFHDLHCNGSGVYPTLQRDPTAFKSKEKQTPESLALPGSRGPGALYLCLRTSQILHFSFFFFSFWFFLKQIGRFQLF